MEGEFGEVSAGVFIAEGQVSEIECNDEPENLFKRAEPPQAESGPKRRFPKLVAATALATIALACALTKSKGAKLAIIAGSCIAQTHGFTVNPIMAEGQAFSFFSPGKQFTSFDVLEFPVADKSIAQPVDQSNYGVVDTGATRSSSYKKKLFPPKLIIKVNPPYRVRIADGSFLPVTAEGSMAIKTRARGSTSAKKLIIILAAESLLVPQMHVTLISPRSLFHQQGIRTYFNDELHFLLPSGDVVDFIETDRNYLVLLEEGLAFDHILEDTLSGRHKALPALRLHAHDAHDAHRVTLLEPLPLTSDRLHARIMHFSWDKLECSERFLEGIDLGKFKRSNTICDACVRGAFRGHRKGHRDRSRFTKFGQRIYRTVERSVNGFAMGVQNSRRRVLKFFAAKCTRAASLQHLGARGRT